MIILFLLKKKRASCAGPKWICSICNWIRISKFDGYKNLTMVSMCISSAAHGGKWKKENKW